MLGLPISLLFLLIHFANALPHPSETGLAIPLIRANQGRKTPREKAAWAFRQAIKLKAKYNVPLPPHVVRRAAGNNDLVNHNQDSSYFGSLAAGTPETAFNVILDTGSSDLWLASSDCHTGCVGVPTFNSAMSSTFQNLSTPFRIQYGSGAATGTLAHDVIQMAGFKVEDQTFALVNAVSPNLLTNPVSGLMGLGFGSIASSKAIPFWQTLFKGGKWDAPVMTFYLTRFINSPRAQAQEPGGRFTMGFIDSRLHSGDIEFIDIPSGQVGYWILPMTTLNVNGESIDIGTSSRLRAAAIDTGTTLIGGPPDVVNDIFSKIPGSQPGVGDFDGYYTYPCSTKVNISIAFGGTLWDIDPDDFLLTQLTKTRCLGALFQLDMGGNGPSWIIGDTFLKNVYSVFRAEPPSIGFAKLSVAALDLAVAGGPLPSQTIGANPVLATSSTSGQQSLSPSDMLWFALASLLLLFL